jgi:multimeric flavodoxin WrbA
MSGKNLLGIIGSYRKVGNSEIIAKTVAEKMEGWTLSLIRLPLLKIDPCKGCYACLFPDIPCNIKDDMQWLFDRMIEADSIIFAVPNYILGPVGIVKMIADRSLQASCLFDILQGKPTAIALTMGKEEYRGYADTSLLAQVSSLGFKVSALEIFVGTHPGEAALLEGYQERIDRLSQSLLCRDQVPGEITSNSRCPRCHSDLFRFVTGEIECALCKSRAVIKNKTMDFHYFHPEFGPEQHDEHMKWLIGKKEEYQLIKEKLAEIRENYREGNWLSPGYKGR